MVIWCLGNLNGFTLIQGQVPMAAAQDHLFLKAFGQRSKQGVPCFDLCPKALRNRWSCAPAIGTWPWINVKPFKLPRHQMTTPIPTA